MSEQLACNGLGWGACAQQLLEALRAAPAIRASVAVNRSCTATGTGMLQAGLCYTPRNDRAVSAGP